MSKLPLLLAFTIIIAALPIINNWLSIKDKALSDDYIDERVEAYIDKNMSKIINGIEKKDKLRNNAPKSRISQYTERLLDPSYPYSGNKESKIVVIGFFDYSCGYCKIMKDDTKQLIKDGKIKYIFRDTPILSEYSLEAARSALAVYFIDREKYFDFYYAALSHNGGLSQHDILNIVNSIEIDENDFHNSMLTNSDKIEKMINENRLLMRDLGISGTPFVVIDYSVFVGATDLATLRKKVDQIQRRVQD
ncbi:MAG: DsbA family protein [Wolbachia endosymbiont of Fragariocoptes setiger]|nr:DsbA family protein [Wolbachia endosymbiont of Fragariocoptes setiger]